MSGVAACSVSAERYKILSVKIGAGYKSLLVKPFSVMSKRNSEILTLRSYVNLSNTVQVEKVRKYASSTLNVNDTSGYKMLRHFFPVVDQISQLTSNSCLDCLNFLPGQFQDGRQHRDQSGPLHGFGQGQELKCIKMWP